MNSYGSYRDLLIKEAGATTGFYQKLDLLSENPKASLQIALREYADLRLEALLRSERVQKQI